MNIFIAKLSYSTSQEDLKAIFEAFGDVKSAQIIFDKQENRSKGFGFVEMEEESAALKAIAYLHESKLDGRTILVRKARPRPETDSSHDQARRG